MKEVVMDMHILEAQYRVWKLHRDYFPALEAAGYGSLAQSKRHIAIKHMLPMVNPHYLKSRVKCSIQWREDENF